MQITIKLFASFRVGRFKSETWERSEKTTVAQIVTELGIPDEEVGTILVNSRHVNAGWVLDDGDTCSIFPLVGGG